MASAGLRRTASITSRFIACTKEGRCFKISDAHDGDFGIVHDDFHACRAHLRTAHPEKLHIDPLAQCRREARRVHVSGSFTRGKQKWNWGHGKTCRSVARRQGCWQWRRTRAATECVAVVQFLLFVLQLIQSEV